MLGGLLDEVVRDDLHHGLVDLAIDEVASWLVENPGSFAEVLGERAPWWAPPRLNDAVTRRLHRELVDWLLDIRHDPTHHARQALDSMLRQLAHDLQHDADTQARTEKLKDRLLDHPQVLASSVDLWNALRRALQASLVDPEGAVRTRMLVELTAFAERLVDDSDLRKRLDLLAADAAVFAIDRYGAELTAVITHTIERWDGKEAARRIELHVGRDLQFIRINGTIVGGLVGVVIHAFAWLSGTSARLRRPSASRPLIAGCGGAPARQTHSACPYRVVRAARRALISAARDTTSPGTSWRPRRVSTSSLTRTIPAASSGLASDPESTRSASLRNWPSLIDSSLMRTSVVSGLSVTRSIIPARRLWRDRLSARRAGPPRRSASRRA